MVGSDRIVALDVGASKVVLAEFIRAKSGVPRLMKYGVGRLDIEPDSEADKSAFIVSTIRDIQRSEGIKPAPLLIALSGQAVFPRYVKLPPVSREKLLQIVRYEAQQNVPFPIEEVVWDYQLIPGADTSEVSVMLVAVKTDNVSKLTDCVQAANLEPEIVDVAPMALYNVVRYNYPDLRGCTMVLDMGARSSNLIFIEGDRIFSRSIPVAGNTITREVMKELEAPFEEAEQLKKAEGFVGLGGVYAGPDNEVADRISKISRNVIGRLHAEVNRSVNFYRSQQGGNPPSLILLTGGAAMMPHTDTFFREKMKVEVEYLNPFVNIEVDEKIDAERVSEDANVLGEVVGLSLRRYLSCPVEINLMPPELVKKKTLRRRQPFFALAATGVILTMLCWWAYMHRMRTFYEKQLLEVEVGIENLQTVDARLNKVLKEKEAAIDKLATLSDTVKLRSRWIEILKAVAESTLDGMWLTSLTPMMGEGGAITGVRIEGRGFEDLLRDYSEADKTAIEVFRDRLRAKDQFTDQTEIVHQPPLGAEAYARDFTVNLVLTEAIPGDAE